MKLSQKIALNSSVQAMRQVFLAVAGIVSVAVATRYLTVDQYGAVLAAVVLIGLFSIAADFGISAMTVRAMARDPENEVAIQSSAFWVWVAFTVPVALLILAVAQVAYPGPEHQTTRSAVLIMLATFPLMPVFGAANARATADQRVWLISLASIGGRGLSLLAVIGAASFDLGPLGITAAFASGYIFEQALGILFVRPRIRPMLGWHRARIWSLIAAAVPLGTVLVINSLYFKLDAFLLSLLGTKADLAVYGVAYKAFESLLVLPEFVMITLLPVLARLGFGEHRYRELVQKAFTTMCIMALPIVGFSVLGNDAMVALAGPQYAGGGVVLGLIMSSVAIACVQGVFGNSMVTQGRQAALLKVSISVLIANGLINLALIPPFGDVGAGVALLCSEALSISLTLVVYSRYAPLPRVHAPVRWLLAGGALALTALACRALSNPILSVMVGVALGSAVYVAALVALRALPRYVTEPIVSVVRAIKPRSAT
jgi:O-antigen/teichoic acid export membrane protein